VRASILISGKVQGVFFRVSGLSLAQRFGLKCITKNKSDGTVQFIVGGEGINIEKFISWCNGGPPLAKVINVEVTWLNSLPKTDRSQAEK